MLSPTISTMSYREPTLTAAMARAVSYCFGVPVPKSPITPNRRDSSGACTACVWPRVPSAQSRRAAIRRRAADVDMSGDSPERVRNDVDDQRRVDVEQYQCGSQKPVLKLRREQLELLKERRRYRRERLAFRIKVVDAHAWHRGHLRQDVVFALKRVPHHLSHVTGDLLAEDLSGPGVATRLSKSEGKPAPEFSAVAGVRIDSVLQQIADDLLAQLRVGGDALLKDARGAVGPSWQLLSNARCRRDTAEQHGGEENDETCAFGSH